MTSDDTPIKCKECSKLNSIKCHRHCDICQILELEEDIFCDLNRAVQDENNFRCSAFEPKLKVVTSSKKSEEIDSPPLQARKKKPYENLLNSEKIKYERALALQRLKRDPDAVFIQIKYHFTWNVVCRFRIFRDDKSMIKTAIELFNESSLVVNDFVHLLFLAPDHVHLLVESNGELSVEELVNRIKKHACNGLFKKYPQLKRTIDNDSIWDDAYFAETIS